MYGGQEQPASTPPTLMREIFECAFDAMLVVDQTGSIEMVNAQTEMMFGHSREELLGRRVELLMPERFRQKHVEHLARYFSNPWARPMTMALGVKLYGLRKDGAEFPVEIVLAPVKTGERVHTSATIRDITEREKVDSRLRQSEALQRKLLDASMDSICLTRLSDGCFLYVNEKFLERGYTREEILGKSARELRLIEVAASKRLFSELKTRGSFHNQEVDVRMADGRMVPNLVSSVLVDLDGAQCVLTVARDITEIKLTRENLIATQDRLRRSETRLRKIFETSPDTICISALRDGRYIDANPRFTSSTGYTLEEVKQGPPDAGRTWADRKQFLRFLFELSQKGIVDHMEANFRLKDGTVKPCLISAVIVELEGEQCVVTFSSDISRLKQIERELIRAREEAEAASRAKSEFLSSMSHEIRTPMNAILGMADLLTETELTPEQRRFVSSMTRNGDALLNLLNGILDLARIESGLLQLEQAEFDLEELVGGVAETLSAAANEKGLELTARIAPDLPLRLIGDSLRLRQVMINLVGNAIKFTEKGEVALTVENKVGADGAVELHFSVRDTGIGIAPDKLELVFQKFSQADSSTTRKHGGSGLGLAIASRLVELMGGRIWVTSAVGRGSTFHFVACFKVGERSGVVAERPPCLERVRVLVIDDNATNRLILREVLTWQGAEVREASGGQQALIEAERARTAGEPYRLVLLDHRMPEMDGVQLAKQLRHETGCGPPIILMLSSEDLHYAPKLAREAGIFIYIVKPVRRTELLDAIAVAMSGKPVEADPASKSRLSDSESTDGSRPLKTILLAEDSLDNRRLIEEYLKNAPYELDLAEDGQVAVTKFIRGKYDLVLMDVAMPVMDGYTAVRKIRQWEFEKGRPPTPIAALTASVLKEDVRASMEAGCTTHLSKPIRKSRLLAAIHNLTSAPVDGSAEESRMKILVEIDSLLADLVPGFLARKREDLYELTAALERLDYHTLRSIGQKIRGEGAGLGLKVISEIGSTLEKAARFHDADAVEQEIRALMHYLAYVEVRCTDALVI